MALAPHRTGQIAEVHNARQQMRVDHLRQFARGSIELASSLTKGQTTKRFVGHGDLGREDGIARYYTRQKAGFLPSCWIF